MASPEKRFGLFLRGRRGRQEIHDDYSKAQVDEVEKTDVDHMLLMNAGVIPEGELGDYIILEDKGRVDVVGDQASDEKVQSDVSGDFGPLGSLFEDENWQPHLGVRGAILNPNYIPPKDVVLEESDQSAESVIRSDMSSAPERHMPLGVEVRITGD